MMQQRANIVEIFSSLQGEGPHTGVPTTFVRFAGCSISCRWCDTATASKCTPEYAGIETPPSSRKFVNYANPFTVEVLNEHLAYFTDAMISITGGEPLEQADFIQEWLSGARPDKKILLETNGVHAAPLEKVSKYVDIISMDIKLPSSTGKRGFWLEHSAFLMSAIKSGKELYVKIVITPDTVDKDIQEAIKIISASNKFIPVVLQPVSETESFRQKISDEQLQSFARLCNLWLPNVSIMPQMHKAWGIL